MLQNYKKTNSLRIYSKKTDIPIKIFKISRKIINKLTIFFKILTILLTIHFCYKYSLPALKLFPREFLSELGEVFC